MDDREPSARDLYFERALAEIEHRRQWGEDVPFEGYALIQSTDGGEAWEFQGTFGMPEAELDTTPYTLDLIKQHGRRRGVQVRCIPYSKLGEYGLDIANAPRERRD